MIDLNFRRFSTIIVLLWCSLSAKGQQGGKFTTMGGAEKDEIIHHVTDKDGNIYAVGHFSDTLFYSADKKRFFLPGTSTRKTFITKHDKSQQLIWARELQGNKWNLTRKIQLDSRQNVYVLGNFEGRVDFDPGSGTKWITESARGKTATHKWDLYLLKLDSAGSFVWVKTIDHVLAQDLLVDQDDTISCVGGWAWTTDFNPDSSSAHFRTPNDTLIGDGFLVSFDTNGLFQQFLHFEAKGHLWRIDQGDSGSYNLGIKHDGKADLNPGLDTFPSINRGEDMVVLDSNFGFVNGYPGYAGKYLRLQNGAYYLLRNFTGIIDIDPGPGVFTVGTTPSTEGTCIARFNKDNRFLWGKQFGYSGSHTSAFGMCADSSNNVLIVGYTAHAPFFKPVPKNRTITPKFYWTAFFCHFSDSGTVNWLTFLHSTGNDDFPRGRTVSMYQDKFIVSGDYIEDCYYYHDKDIDTIFGYGKLPSALVHSTDGFILSLEDCPSDTIFRSLKVCDVFCFPNTDSCTRKSGKYVMHHENGFACDSIVVYDLKISQRIVTKLSKLVCDSIMFKNKWVKEQGIYRDTLRTINNCDSIIVLFLDVLRSVDTTITTKACDQIVYRGKLYNKSDSFIEYLKTPQWCDSIVRHKIIISSTEVVKRYETSCDSILYQTKWLKSSGIYRDTFTNRNQCDSIVELELDITKSKNTKIEVKACDSLFYKGKIRRSSESFMDSLLTTSGCDSLVLTSLVILQSFDSIISVTACRSYKLPDGTVTDSSGSFVFSNKSAEGCDSNYTINLHVVTIDTSLVRSGDTLFASELEAQYQWLDCTNNYSEILGKTERSFIPDSIGNYAVKISRTNCSDTSNCYSINVTSVPTISRSIKIYPNPNSGSFIISLSHPVKQANLRIYTSAGNLIHEKFNLEGRQFFINKIAVPGVYTGYLTTKDGTFRFRIIHIF